MRKNNTNGNRKAIMRVVVLAGLLVSVVVISSLVTKSGSGDLVTAVEAQPLTQLVGADQSTSVTEALGPITRMVGALIVVILCIYIGLFVLRKMMGKRHHAIADSGALQVLQTAHLAPRRSVSLIKVANRAVLIGVTDNHLSVLTELSEEETSEILQASQSSPEPDQFGPFLAKAMRKIRDLRPHRQEAVTSTR